MWTKIKSIKKLPKKDKIGRNVKSRVYNLHCEPHNNYFSNNILVHNCYHRYTTWDCKDPAKKENWIIPIEQLKQQAVAAKNRGCNCCDITGGEPLIHPKIVEFIEFLTELKIQPRIITNGQASESKMYQVIGAGCKNFLFSMHDIDEKLSKLMQVPDAYNKMIKNIELVKERGCRFAFNTVIYNFNYNRLDKIAARVVSLKPYLYNIINCNPSYNTDVDKHKNMSAEVSKIKPFLQKAIDVAKAKNIWTNVRYYPMCAVDEEYRKHIVDHPQVMFDFSNEWDYGVASKTVKRYLKHGREAFQYQSNQQDGKCGECSMRNVCGGVNKIYPAVYGDKELNPIDTKSDYPFFYRSDMEEVDIVIPMYRVGHNISRLMEEIVHKTAPPYNIILVHREQSAAQNRNKGLVKGTAPYMIMMDDDIAELPYMWNKRMIDRLHLNPNVMAVSARLLKQDGSVSVNSANNFNIKSEYEIVDMIPTACCAFRRADVDRAKLKFDERMVKSGWEDTAFFYQLRESCKRLELGTDIIIDNNCKVVHLHHATGYDDNFDYNRSVFEQIIGEEEEKDNREESEALLNEEKDNE